jgi:hypothetical protein
MNEAVTKEEACEELREVFPNATVELFEDEEVQEINEEVISVEFDPRGMFGEKVLVHYETPRGWLAYKTVFGPTKVKFYLERPEEEE